MIAIAWHYGAVLWIPSAWTAWRIGDVACSRDAHGFIVAFVGEQWRRVESCQAVEAQPAALAEPTR